MQSRYLLGLPGRLGFAKIIDYSVERKRSEVSAAVSRRIFQTSLLQRMLRQQRMLTVTLRLDTMH